MGWLRFSYRLILLPSFAALACCACRPTGNAALITTVEAPLTEISTTEANRTNAESTDKSLSLPAAQTQPANGTSASQSAYQAGINLASSAHVLSQSALSPDDWGLIASRWQRAADQLEKVSQQDSNYEQAQQKAEEYRLNAKAANERIAQLQSPIYVPLPAARPSSIRAQATESQSAPHTPSAPTGTLTTAGTAQAPFSQSTQIPILRRLHGTPIVRVTFNGSQTYEMILDTGASRTLITRQMARDLGVVTTERMIATTASQAEVSFDVGQVDTISMGGIVLENARVSIGDAVHIGLLGNDFLRDYDVTIRSQAGFVELNRT